MILIHIKSRSLCYMCPSAPRVRSEPGGQKPVLSLSLDRINEDTIQNNTSHAGHNNSVYTITPCNKIAWWQPEFCSEVDWKATCKFLDFVYLFFGLMCAHCNFRSGNGSWIYLLGWSLGNKIFQGAVKPDSMCNNRNIHYLCIYTKPCSLEIKCVLHNTIHKYNK